jgi:hypothetical protein
VGFLPVGGGAPARSGLSWSLGRRLAIFQLLRWKLELVSRADAVGISRIGFRWLQRRRSAFPLLAGCGSEGEGEAWWRTLFPLLQAGRGGEVELEV